MEEVKDDESIVNHNWENSSDGGLIDEEDQQNNIMEDIWLLFGNLVNANQTELWKIFDYYLEILVNLCNKLDIRC